MNPQFFSTMGNLDVISINELKFSSGKHWRDQNIYKFDCSIAKCMHIRQITILEREILFIFVFLTKTALFIKTE